MSHFISDNTAPVAPEIMVAIADCNHDAVLSYGHDDYTQKAKALLQAEFGGDSRVFFVYNGTAANALALKSVLNSYDSVICAGNAHIVSHEVGAVTALTGASTLQLAHQAGKITPQQIETIFEAESRWGAHATRPKVVSITQATELGTVYSVDEIKTISAMCRQLGLYLHMDGCRLYNAAVALSASLKAITREAGVDILSLGGTKNGLMFGEAVVFLNPQLAADKEAEFAYIHKQGLQLHSKMRYLTAQFIPFFEQKLWQRYAQTANAQAQSLVSGLKKLGYDEKLFAYPVQSNQLFLQLSAQQISAIQAKSGDVLPFYLFDARDNIVRLVTSFATTEADIERLLAVFAV